MTRTALGFCAAAVFGMAVSAGAQTGTASSSQESMQKNEVKVTGCLERSPNGGYILTNATKDEGTASHYGTQEKGTTGEYGSTASTSGTETQSGTSSSSSSMNANEKNETYRLEGSSSELAKHVGHKIEVTAREANPSEAGATAGTSGSSTSGTSGSMSGSAAGGSTSGMTNENAHAPRLDVESVRMISSTCS